LQGQDWPWGGIDLKTDTVDSRHAKDFVVELAELLSNFFENLIVFVKSSNNGTSNAYAGANANAYSRALPLQ